MNEHGAHLRITLDQFAQGKRVEGQGRRGCGCACARRCARARLKAAEVDRRLRHRLAVALAQQFAGRPCVIAAAVQDRVHLKPAVSFFALEG